MDHAASAKSFFKGNYCCMGPSGSIVDTGSSQAYIAEGEERLASTRSGVLEPPRADALRH